MLCASADLLIPAAASSRPTTKFASSDLRSARKRKKIGGPHSASSLRDALLTVTPDSVTTTTNRPDRVGTTCCPSRVHRRGQATPGTMSGPRPPDIHGLACGQTMPPGPGAAVVNSCGAARVVATVLRIGNGLCRTSPRGTWPLGFRCGGESVWYSIHFTSLAVARDRPVVFDTLRGGCAHLVLGPVARTKRGQKHKVPP